MTLRQDGGQIPQMLEHGVGTDDVKTLGRKALEIREVSLSKAHLDLRSDPAEALLPEVPGAIIAKPVETQHLPRPHPKPGFDVTSGSASGYEHVASRQRSVAIHAAPLAFEITAAMPPKPEVGLKLRRGI